jgi:hypothetical protein
MEDWVVDFYAVIIRTPMSFFSQSILFIDGMSIVSGFSRV